MSSHRSSARPCCRHSRRCRRKPLAGPRSPRDRTPWCPRGTRRQGLALVLHWQRGHTHTHIVYHDYARPVWRGVKHSGRGKLTRQCAVQELQVVQRHVAPLAFGPLRVEAEPEAAGNATQEDGVFPPASHAGGFGAPHHGLLGVSLENRGP